MALVQPNSSRSQSRTTYDRKFLFDTVLLLNRFLWLCLGFEGWRSNRRKKHGKRNVSHADGFGSVAYDIRRKQLVPGFTNRKDLAALPKRSAECSAGSVNAHVDHEKDKSPKSIC